MIHFLNDVCTIMKPNFDDSGKIVWEDFGDCFCKIEKGNTRFVPGDYTHMAIIEINGAMPGDSLITTQHDYLIVNVNKKENLLGLIVLK